MNMKRVKRMKIKNITSVGRKKVYDLSVEDAEHYVLENGVVTHNTGIMYSSDNVWIIGRRQEKEGKEIIGYEFIINIEKSRFVKEKSKIPIAVSYDGGIMRWSGLLELATEGGFVGKPNMGFYQHIDPETGEMIGPKLRAKATMNKEFWEPVFEKTDFREFLKKKYTLGYQTMMSQDEDNIEETEEKV